MSTVPSRRADSFGSVTNWQRRIAFLGQLKGSGSIPPGERIGVAARLFLLEAVSSPASGPLSLTGSQAFFNRRCCSGVIVQPTERKYYASSLSITIGALRSRLRFPAQSAFRSVASSNPGAPT
jgi:hypothetical protein